MIFADIKKLKEQNEELIKRIELLEKCINRRFEDLEYRMDFFDSKIEKLEKSEPVTAGVCICSFDAEDHDAEPCISCATSVDLTAEAPAKPKKRSSKKK